MIPRHLKFGSALSVVMLLSACAVTAFAADSFSPPLAPPTDPAEYIVPAGNEGVELPPAPPKAPTATSNASPGLLGGPASEDTGIVRITDHPNGLSNSGACTNGQEGSTCNVQGRSRCPGCPNCAPCAHGYTRGTCPYGCKPSAWTMAQYRRKYGTVYSYDYGWAPPGMHPIEYTSVSYNRYFPGQWTGQPAAGPAVVRPRVYYPTDTTQQGYYYQHAPAWIPVNGMVPPVPNPNEWHQNLCQGVGHGGVNGGNCPNCQHGTQVPTEAIDTPIADPVSTQSAGAPLNRTPGAPALLPVNR